MSNQLYKNSIAEDILSSTTHISYIILIKALVECRLNNTSWHILRELQKYRLKFQIHTQKFSFVVLFTVFINVYTCIKSILYDFIYFFLMSIYTHTHTHTYIYVYILECARKILQLLDWDTFLTAHWTQRSFQTSRCGVFTFSFLYSNCCFSSVVHL